MPPEKPADKNPPPATQRPRTWTERLRGLWRDWVKPILIVVVILSLFRSAVADWNDVPTGSMNPTIVPGDRIVVNKLAYDLRVPFAGQPLVRWSKPARGQIITFFSPQRDIRMVKRVIALGGDTVEYVNARLIITTPSGKTHRASYAALSSASTPGRYHAVRETLMGQSHRIYELAGPHLSPRRLAYRNFNPIKIPRGQVWVMGDNRDRSADSRKFGPVPIANITGQALGVALSLDYDDHYLPRWGRFGQAFE